MRRARVFTKGYNPWGSTPLCFRSKPSKFAFPILLPGSYTCMPQIHGTPIWPLPAIKYSSNDFGSDPLPKSAKASSSYSSTLSHTCDLNPRRVLVYRKRASPSTCAWILHHQKKKTNSLFSQRAPILHYLPNQWIIPYWNLTLVLSMFACSNIHYFWPILPTSIYLPM